MPESPDHRPRPRGGRFQVLALVVGVLSVVLVATGVLVWRDATGRSSVSLTDAKPDRPRPSATGTPTPTPTPTDTATTSQKTSLDQAVKGRQSALSDLAGRAQKQSAARRAESAKAAKAAEAAATPSASFVFAQFNVQGSSHRGNVGERSRHAASLLRSSGATVAALQEFAPANRRAFFGATSGWSEANLGLKSYENDNALLWRSDTWSLVKAETKAYPYFGGKSRRMPRVLLKNNATGAEVWFASYHNAASCCGHANSVKWRRIAVSKQAADANSLRAATGQPLVVAGDMNDRREYFCDMAPRANMHSADGGTATNGCRPPGRIWIDWVMGTADVTFSGYHRDDSGYVDAASDHPFITTTVSVGG